MNIPDVLALEVEDAKERCRQTGWEIVDIIRTGPAAPREGTPSGRFRVIRFDVLSSGKATITVAEELTAVETEEDDT